MWINQNFLLPSEVVAEHQALDVKFLSLRTETPLFLKMTSNGEVSRSNSEYNFFKILNLLISPPPIPISKG